MESFKIVVLGGTGVGKSSFIFQFVQEVYVEDYDPTIEDVYIKNVIIDEKTSQLEILDTVDSEMLNLYIQSIDGILLLYSITDFNSYNYCLNIYNQFLQIEALTKPMILVGTKCDLQKERVVSTIKGVNLAEKLGNCLFMETSSKENMNVKETFYELTKMLHKKVKII